MTIKENPYYNSRGGSRSWSRLRARVVREEPQCRLRLTGCTGVSTTADHIIPKSIRPDLVMLRSNLQGACRHCNQRRGNKLRIKKVPPKGHGPARGLEFFE